MPRLSGANQVRSGSVARKSGALPRGAYRRRAHAWRVSVRGARAAAARWRNMHLGGVGPLASAIDLRRRAAAAWQTQRKALTRQRQRWRGRLKASFAAALCCWLRLVTALRFTVQDSVRWRRAISYTSSSMRKPEGQVCWRNAAFRALFNAAYARISGSSLCALAAPAFRAHAFISLLYRTAAAASALAYACTVRLQRHTRALLAAASAPAAQPFRSIQRTLATPFCVAFR